MRRLVDTQLITTEARERTADRIEALPPEERREVILEYLELLAQVRRPDLIGTMDELPWQREWRNEWRRPMDVVGDFPGRTLGRKHPLVKEMVKKHFGGKHPMGR
jgi:hypothetical protein